MISAARASGASCGVEVLDLDKGRDSSVLSASVSANRDRLIVQAGSNHRMHRNKIRSPANHLSLSN